MKNPIQIAPSEMFQFVGFLNSFLPVVDSKIPTHINGGGCGIFAKHLYLTLKELGVESKIIYLANKKCEVGINYLKENNKVGKKRFGVEHCLIGISDTIFLDSKGIELTPTITSQIKSVNTGELSIETLELLNANIDSWNEVFDRGCEEQIKTELGKMGSAFESYKKGKFSFTIDKEVRLSEHTINIDRKMRMESFFGGLSNMAKKMKVTNKND